MCEKILVNTFSIGHTDRKVEFDFTPVFLGKTGGSRGVNLVGTMKLSVSREP